MMENSFHVLKALFTVIVVTTVMLTCLCAGYLFGVRSMPRHPIHILSTEVMGQLWENDVKASIALALNAEGIPPDSIEGNSFMEEHYDRFEPYVFAHPFIILKDKVTSDYRVFMSTAEDRFDNLGVPLVDIRNVSDEANTRKRYTHFTLHRNTQTPRGKEPTAMVCFATDGHGVITNASFAYFDSENDFIPRYYYNDTNGDGIFDSIVFVPPEGKMINYAPKDFFETFTSDIASPEESSPTE